MDRPKPRVIKFGRNLGARIRQLREIRGMTQEQLAYGDEGDLNSKGYLSDIESGRRLPSLTALIEIARRLGVEPFELLVFPNLNEPHIAVEAVLERQRR